MSTEEVFNGKGGWLWWIVGECLEATSAQQAHCFSSDSMFKERTELMSGLWWGKNPSMLMLFIGLWLTSLGKETLLLIVPREPRE